MVGSDIFINPFQANVQFMSPENVKKLEVFRRF